MRHRRSVWSLKLLSDSPAIAHPGHSSNIPFEKVLNVRDIRSAFPEISGGKVFRCGCVSNASEADVPYITVVLLVVIISD